MCKIEFEMMDWKHRALGTWGPGNTGTLPFILVQMEVRKIKNDIYVDFSPSFPEK